MSKLIWSFLFLCSYVYAAAPDWTINLLQYEQRMSYTALISIDTRYSSNLEDKIGVYLGDELRGIGQITFVDSMGRGIFLFQMGLNTGDEGNATFKIYDKNGDRIIDAKTVTPVIINGIVGSLENPFVISNTDLYREGELLYNNYISPNNDLLNDALKIENVEQYQGFELSIFTEDGAKLYHSNPYKNDWEGTYRGELLPTGVYYFIFYNKSLNKQFSGSFSLKQR